MKAKVWDYGYHNQNLSTTKKASKVAGNFHNQAISSSWWDGGTEEHCEIDPDGPDDDDGRRTPTPDGHAS